MAWFKVDDKLHSHKKSARAGVAAMGLWTVAGSWCADQLTDGFVPDYIAERLAPGESSALAQRLVDAGLWVAESFDGDEGWRFAGWNEYQPTRDAVEAKREQERDKKRAQRRSATGQFTASPSVSPGDSPRDHPEDTPGESNRARPDPTRPVPEKVNTVVESAAPSSTSLVLVPPDPPAPKPPDPVVVVFDAWREATGHDRAKLTDDRRKRIRRWLGAGYTPDDLADACRGVTLSDFHQGANDRHTVYDDLAVVLKDSRNIERFMDLARNGPPPAARTKPRSADAVRRLAQGGDR